MRVRADGDAVAREVDLRQRRISIAEEGRASKTAKRSPGAPTGLWVERSGEDFGQLREEAGRRVMAG